MKINIVAAFIIALVIHLGLVAALVINISLDKPKRPNENVGKIMHATIISAPPKGNPNGQKVNASSKKEQQSIQQNSKNKELEAKKAELEKQIAAQKALEQKRQEDLE